MKPGVARVLEHTVHATESGHASALDALRDSGLGTRARDLARPDAREDAPERGAAQAPSRPLLGAIAPLLQPLPHAGKGHCCRPGQPFAKQCRQDLKISRGREVTPQPTHRLACRDESPGPARRTPEPEQRLEAPAGDAQIVDRLRIAAALEPAHCALERAPLARVERSRSGVHPLHGRAAVHALHGRASVRVLVASSPETPRASSAAMSASERVASTVRNSYSRESPSSSSIRRCW